MESNRGPSAYQPKGLTARPNRLTQIACVSDTSHTNPVTRNDPSCVQLSTSQTAVSAEPASSTGKPVPGCTDGLCHTILILNIIVGSLLTPGTSACHVTRCLCHRGIRKGDATSARHRRSHISAACHCSYNVNVCPSSVLTTSACAHHRFLQRQPVPIISFYNVSLCPSSVPSTSEYFPLIVFERECSLHQG